MRYQRLIIESGSNAVTVRFHPRLTVISGVGRLERESLIAELRGALDGSRRDIHMETVTDDGRRLAFLRGGEKGRDHVLDVDTNKDITAEFTSPGGRVDLAWKLGYRPDSLINASRIDASLVATMSKQDDTIAQLAALEQQKLWDAAARLVEARRIVEEESDKIGASREDAMLLEEVERRHEIFESAHRNYEIARHHAIFTGGSCALAAIPSLFMNRWVALGFVLVALTTTCVSILLRRHMEHAREEQDYVLAAAGAQSYFSFYIQRVGNVVRSEDSRERVAIAAREHSEAGSQWKDLVGELSVDWVLEQREDIARKAAHLEELRTRGLDYETQTVSHNIDPAEFAQALIVRMSELRKGGDGNESLPLILDEPLLGVEMATKTWVLDLLARSAGSLQIIYMTEDDAVAQWAANHVAEGKLAIVEPAAVVEQTRAHLSIVA